MLLTTISCELKLHNSVSAFGGITKTAFALLFLAVPLTTVSQIFDSSGFTSSVIAMSYHSFRRQVTVLFDDKMTEIQKSSSCHLITIWELGLLLLEHLSHLLFPADNIEFSTFSFLFSFLNLSLIQPLLFVPLLCFGSCSIEANMIKK